MVHNYTARLRAALNELHGAIADIVAPDMVELEPLEDLVTKFGTLHCATGQGHVIFKMAPLDKGRSGLGSLVVTLYSSRVDIGLSHKDKVFDVLDWSAFTAEVHAATVTAMQTKPGWSTYRRHLVATTLNTYTRRLTADARSAEAAAGWIECGTNWQRITCEPDPVVSALAERMYLAGDFDGTVDDALAAARTAAAA